MKRAVGFVLLILLAVPSANASFGLNIGANGSYVSNINSGARQWSPTGSLELVYRRNLGEVGIFADDMMIGNWSSWNAMTHVPFFGFVVRGFIAKNPVGPTLWVKLDPVTLVLAYLGSGASYRSSSLWYLTGLGVGVGYRFGAKGETGFAVQPNIGIRFFYNPNLYLSGFNYLTNYSQLFTFDMGVTISLF